MTTILVGMLPSWRRALSGENKSPETIKSYVDTARRLDAYLTREGLPVGADGIRAFLTAERERTSDWTAQKHYRNLSVYFSWLTREPDTGVSDNPMTRIAKPKVSEQAPEFFSEAELAALLRVTKGDGFEARRDHAIIRSFIDCGVRVSGLANLRFDPADDDATDVFLDQNRLRVRLKGGNIWWVPIGRRTVAALDRYIRVRARHSRADSPWLWLGMVGHKVDHFGASGIRQMLTRRGGQAGVADCHPHKFRATFADSWLAAEGNIDDLMSVAGWKSMAMPLRYARGRRVARAADAHRRLSPGDRL